MTDVTPPAPPEYGTAPPDDGDRWMLSAYLDDELSAEERALVEARLADSDEWRAEMQEVRVARDAVRGLGLRDAPDGFWPAVERAVAAAPDSAPSPQRGPDDPPPVEPNDAAAVHAATVTDLDEQRARRQRRRRVATWAASGVAAAVLVGAMFVIPGRDQVRPNVTAVVTHHGATSASQGDPVSGLVPLAPMRSSR